MGIAICMLRGCRVRGVVWRRWLGWSSIVFVSFLVPGLVGGVWEGDCGIWERENGNERLIMHRSELDSSMGVPARGMYIPTLDDDHGIPSLPTRRIASLHPHTPIKTERHGGMSAT